MRRRHGKHDIDPRTQREYLTDPPKEGPAGGSARDNPYSVNPASPLRRGRTDPREIEHVSTNAESEESQGQYRRRISENDYSERVRKADNRNRALIATLIVAASLVVAGFVAWNVYLHSVDSNLSSGISKEIEAALTETTDDKAPYYALLVGTDDVGEGGGAAVSSIMLVRVDPTTPAITVLSLPCDTRVYVGGVGYEQLSSVHADKGAAGLIGSVEDLTGIKVNHYVQYDAASALGIVDGLRGISFDVPDNTSYNGVSVPSGPQELTSAQALVCFRSYRNYTTGVDQQMRNQRLMLLDIVDGVAHGNFLQRIWLLSAISDGVDTDMDVLQLLAVASVVSGTPEDAVYSAVIPTTTETVDGTVYSIVDTADLATMMQSVDAGEDPLGGLGDVTVDVVPSDYRVFVRNGSGVSGCATQAADKLSAAGYAIQGTGNADQFVYDETLVVYDTPEKEALAEAVVSTLGVGRAVQNLGGYTYEGDLLVVVGKDWIPT